MTSRLIACWAIAILFAGCSSQKPAVRTDEKRDYYSLNKSSVKFLFGTFSQDRRLRRAGQKRIWNPGELRRENAQIQKDSISFLWDSLKAEEWTNTKQAWGTDLWRELMPEVNYWSSARFGFLDSGD